MVVTTDAHGKTQFLGISNALIAGMSDDELVAELERVKQEQKRFASNLKGQPRYVRYIEENVREASCRASERRRIEREMQRRYEKEMERDLQQAGCQLCPVTYQVAVDQAMDASDAGKA